MISDEVAAFARELQMTTRQVGEARELFGESRWPDEVSDELYAKMLAHIGRIADLMGWNIVLNSGSEPDNAKQELRWIGVAHPLYDLTITENERA